MPSKISKLLALGALAFGMTSFATAAPNQTQPDIYVVMFRADWCAPCKVVEPRLSEALSTLQDPKIEFLNIDLSSGNGEWNSHAVFDRQIVPQYNMWLGVTGFAAIIDADTKRTLGCLDINYTTDAMTMHISNMKRLALNNEANFDFTCPEANNPV